MARHNWWTDEEKDYLKECYKTMTYSEITEAMSKKFGVEYTNSQISGELKRYNLVGAKNTRFKKGITPWNKGLKGYMGANATSFKKGSVPANLRPIGSERISVDGYTEIKTGKAKWELKHRVKYKEYNGEIPKGYVVMFANGNKQDFRKENLIAISRNQLKTVNKNKLLKNDIEATKTGLLIADIIIKTQELKKGKSNENRR